MREDFRYRRKSTQRYPGFLLKVCITGVMEIINQYFGKTIFIKADIREDHSIYVAALSSSFQDGKKQYALAFVPVHLAIVNQGYLSDLHWVNLQTRTMTNGYRIKPQRWEIPKGLDNPMFTVIDRTEQRTKYRSDSFPLEMVLIHDPKKKTKLQYHNHMNLLAALTTFKCVISLTEQGPSGANYQSFPTHGVYRQHPPPSIQFNPSVGPPPPGYSSREYKSRPLDNEPITAYEFVPPRDVSGGDGRYTTIGLTEYTIPQTPSGPQKNGGSATRGSIPFSGRRPKLDGPQMHNQEPIDDSFELI